METRKIAGLEVQVNDEGYMTDPTQWTREIGIEIAKEEGITDLLPQHWMVIDFCRKSAKSTGKAPTLRQITNSAEVSTKDLFSLFPKGPAKKVARIAGLGKPEGCV